MNSKEKVLLCFLSPTSIFYLESLKIKSEKIPFAKA